MLKKTVLLVILMLIFVTSGMHSEQLTDQYFRVRISFDNRASFRSALKDFNEAGLDIPGVDLHELKIDLIIHRDKFPYIDKTYPVEVIQFPGQEIRVDPEYLEPHETEAIMQMYASIFPDITKLVPVGDTEKGRTIYAMKISKDADQDLDKLTVFFNGQQHAREVMSGEVVMDILEYLLNNYGEDPQVTHWVDSYEIWVMPQANLDGINYVFNNFNMWRKDRHPPPPGSSSYGIDPNRNFPAFWGSCNGSSGSPSNDTYRGEFPGQSYTVSHIMSLAEEIRPVFSISYHSFSELVIYPYGCQGSVTPDHQAMAAIGQEMAALIERDNGTMGYAPGTCWELLYAVDGGDIDWYYAELGTFPYVVELNSSAQGFLPGYHQWRDITVERNRPGWQYLLNRLEGPMITGHIVDACTGEPIEGADFSLLEVPLTADESPRITDLFGRYWYPVLPGNYNVIASADGYGTTVVPISVGSERVEQTIWIVPQGSYGVFPGSLTVHDWEGETKNVIGIGEYANLELEAMSVGATTNVTATLTSSDPHLVVLNGFAEIGDIPDGGTGTTNIPHFEIQASPAAPEGHLAELTVVFSADQSLCAPEHTVFLEISNFVYQCPYYNEDLETDPGYTIDNSGQRGWEFGLPTVGPPGAYIGQNVYATNLTGNYANSSHYRLTSTPFDCSNLYDAELRFFRYLKNEVNYDTAYVKVSNNNQDWTVIWSGYAQDNDWTEQVFDISEIADGQPEVYVRWRLSSDWTINDHGFYIDAISICGKTMPETSPTPMPTWTPGQDCINNGDVNMDGAITAADAQLAFQIALGLYNPTFEEECRADCNGDGVVTAADAQEIFLTALGSFSCADPL